MLTQNVQQVLSDFLWQYRLILQTMKVIAFLLSNVDSMFNICLCRFGYLGSYIYHYAYMFIYMYIYICFNSE